MAGFAVLMLVGLGVAYTASVWLVLSVLLRPPRRTYAAAVARGRPGEPGELTPAREFHAWTVRTARGELPVWDIRGDDPSGPLIVMTHGWADSRIGALLRLQELAPIAQRIIAWDLPGHGEAAGRTGLGTREDADLISLLEHIGPGRDVLLFGWSLGAGISLVAAARTREMNEQARARLPRIIGVIAEAPYRLAITPARNVLYVRRLPYLANVPVAFWIAGIRLGIGPRWRGFDRTGWASRIGCPLMVLHGERDEICPIEDGQAIAAAAGGDLAMVTNGRHNDLWTDPVLAARAGEAARAFVQQVRGLPASPIGTAQVELER